MVLILRLLLFCFSCGTVFGQINGYAQVTAIAGNVLTLANSLQTYDSLTAGKRIILMQMQGASISVAANSPSFGTLASAGSTGLYEVANITAVNSSATSATLSAPLMNSYDMNGIVQIITYPILGTPHYTTSSNLSPVAWNGSTGGVLAFSVNGNLFLRDNISADGKGFRGGAKAGSAATACADTIWRTSAGSSNAGEKGEGIYLTPSNEKAGKAKAVNGGGGGTVHNGGAGGGGNVTAGGDGFYGYPGSGCSTSVSAAGQGGSQLTPFVSRVFMGGGGGGGQENNATGSSGGNGGGIILLRADTIIMDAPCFPLTVSANGSAAGSSGNDGAGGGGAGGSVVLDVKHIAVDNSCPVYISANGGKGGDVTNAASHGAGGGGGQGAIFVTSAGGFPNTVFETKGGTGGSANSSGSPRASDGAGAAGAGVVFGAGTSSLPERFTHTNAEPAGGSDVMITWSSYCENENEYFVLMHTRDGSGWADVGVVNSVSHAPGVSTYSFTHTNAAAGENYYRIKQVPPQGSASLSNILFVSVDRADFSGPYPNPSSGTLQIACGPDEVSPFTVADVNGGDVSAMVEMSYSNVLTLDLSKLPEGIYFIRTGAKRHKVVVER